MMKKIIAIIVSSSYVLALLCLSFMGGMSNTMDHSMGAMAKEMSASHHHTVENDTAVEHQEIQASMECPSCTLAETILSSSASLIQNLIEISGVISLTAMILFSVVMVFHSQKNLSQRGPPFSFVDPFLLHHRTVVMRD